MYYTGNGVLSKHKTKIVDKVTLTRIFYNNLVLMDLLSQINLIPKQYYLQYFFCFLKGKTCSHNTSSAICNNIKYVTERFPKRKL